MGFQRMWIAENKLRMQSLEKGSADLQSLNKLIDKSYWAKLTDAIYKYLLFLIQSFHKNFL